MIENRGERKLSENERNSRIFCSINMVQWKRGLKQEANGSSSDSEVENETI